MLRQVIITVNKSSLPKVYGGFNTSLSWKGFDLSAIFAYSIGGYIYNRDITMILHNGSLEGRDWSTEILKRWTPENRYTDVPALSTTSNNWNSASTPFLAEQFIYETEKPDAILRSAETVDQQTGIEQCPGVCAGR